MQLTVNVTELARAIDNGMQRSRRRLALGNRQADLALGALFGAWDVLMEVSGDNEANEGSFEQIKQQVAAVLAGDVEFTVK